MTRIAVAAMLALMVGGPAQARIIELDAGPGPDGGAVLQSASSDLAEPALFAMMLPGLCLTGYRASGDSGEKFK